MSLSGNLKTVSFPDILQLLATGKKTGILEVKTSTRQKEVAFKSGNIIYASSVNTTEDLLGNMLLHRGKITKTDLVCKLWFDNICCRQPDINWS